MQKLEKPRKAYFSSVQDFINENENENEESPIHKCLDGNEIEKMLTTDI